jgi:hypothetical protein
LCFIKRYKWFLIICLRRLRQINTFGGGSTEAKSVNRVSGKKLIYFLLLIQIDRFTIITITAFQITTMNSNVLFPQLPAVLEDRILSFRIEQILLNLTTGEYLHNFSTSELKGLLKKLSKHECICKEDIGESRWKRTDKIIIVPIHLEPYVKATYIPLKPTKNH